MSKSILDEVRAYFGERTVSTSEVVAFMKTKGKNWSSEFTPFKQSRGLWNFNATPNTIGVATVQPIKRQKRAEPPVAQPQVDTSALTEKTTVLDAGAQFNSAGLHYTPNPNFVPTPEFNTVLKVLKSNRFFPMYVTGPTGVGKSTNAREAAAKLGKMSARITITSETTDDDLFGRKSLKDGNVVWEDGIVTLAAEMGFPVILDEISAGDPRKLFGLYTILEGQRHFIKDANKFVNITPGFNIIATDNTLGKGDESGSYVGTNILNEAFLDRFPVALSVGYPSEATEQKSLAKKFESEGITVDADIQAFIETLVKWAGIIRRTHADGAVEESLSPRRLLFIPEHMAIFGANKRKAVEDVVGRFDPVTRESFLQIYDSLNGAPAVVDTTPDVQEDQTPDISF